MPDREQMTPEELAATLLDFAVADSVHTAEARHRLTEAAASLRRLAACERHWDESDAYAEKLERDNARLREALNVIRITGTRLDAETAREALAGAPDAPDAQEGGGG
jgi:hypothetical protein